jgi:hypothetical protein
MLSIHSLATSSAISRENYPENLDPLNFPLFIEIGPVILIISLILSSRFLKIH